MAVDLEKIAGSFREQMSSYKYRIIICAGTGCMANGSMDVYNEFIKVIAEKGLSVSVQLDRKESDVVMSCSGCQGFCQRGPLVTIYPEGIFYTKVKASDVEEIVEKTLVAGEIVDRLLVIDEETKEHIKHVHEVPFYTKQHRMVLANCGHIDASDINDYIAQGGYVQAERAVKMDGDEICQLVLDSGLKGRGGAGFPTGLKWKFARAAKSEKKYIICNGDEGDPGAFMDRSVMEGNPHAVIEGMLIAAMGIGAFEGHVYVRTEYPLAVERIRLAVDEARKMGFLGDNVFESGKHFDIFVMEGAGAFVCGEETALMSSIEGKRGMPNPKPPFPANKGLYGYSTTINNVETLASVPIVMRDPEAYKALGTENARGTKTFALTGNVVNTGLIEVPFGTTLRTIVDEIGGGVVDDFGNVAPSMFKAVQIGGPSGGCLTRDHIDLPLDYAGVAKVGAIIGSGGLVVMNEQTCMVQIARFFMQFTQNESCGKCTVCREGTKQMLMLLDDIIEGRADETTLPKLEELANAVREGALCGLGQTAPNPVISTLRYFRSEYEEHVNNKHCPTGRCRKLASYAIDADRCKGCTKCARNCPVGAIIGTIKQPHTIDQSKCIKCGTCLSGCPFGAIEIK